MIDGLQSAFWSNVRRTPDGCWSWCGSVDENGYGRFFYEGMYFYAHRLSFGLANDGVSLDAPHVRHTCDNPPCVRPSHLVCGTHRDNMRDMIDRKRNRGAERHSLLARLRREDEARFRASLKSNAVQK